jgi:hypothetical protein
LFLHFFSSLPSLHFTSFLSFLHFFSLLSSLPSLLSFLHFLHFTSFHFTSSVPSLHYTSSVPSLPSFTSFTSFLLQRIHESLGALWVHHDDPHVCPAAHLEVRNLYGKIFLVWHREPPSKSVILKTDLLLVFQKRRVSLDTKSKCQYDDEGPPSKTVILKMTWFWYSKTAL